MADSATRTIELRPDLPLTVAEGGVGRPALVLHGGGGAMTVAPIAGHLAERMRTLTPTHPGWDGAPRPDSIGSVADLAAAYLELLAAEGLENVLVVGSSLGGWLGAAMAAADGGARIGALVLIDAVGIEAEGEPITDFYALDARGIAEHAFHDADAYYVDPDTIPPEQAAQMAANMATMRALAGEPYLVDPGLAERLGAIAVPTLVIWGESDGIATPAYGRAFAAAIPAARFELVADAGHLPQIEQPAATNALLDSFI
jgi:pimeloyl-ACP methyl ester carboxylesterase